MRNLFPTSLKCFKLNITKRSNQDDAKTNCSQWRGPANSATIRAVELRCSSRRPRVQISSTDQAQFVEAEAPHDWAGVMAPHPQTSGSPRHISRKLHSRLTLWARHEDDLLYTENIIKPINILQMSFTMPLPEHTVLTEDFRSDIQKQHSIKGFFTKKWLT